MLEAGMGAPEWSLDINEAVSVRSRRSLIPYYDIRMDSEAVDHAPVPEAMIGAWAAEAERGYEVEGLRRRGRRTLGDAPGAVVPVRMDPALLEALNTRAERDDLSRSEVIRAAVRAWIGAA